ncbi:MAG: LPS assembly lipoprotein LptE [Campylobacterota bacterium]|nr:LPS assembly lipoprotein LptE [Campylobacterota bacterium]
MKYIGLILLLIYPLLIITGCGYKPTSHYAKNSISGDVYVDVKIDINNAQNSVLIKDAMNEMVLNQFEATLTNNKAIADTVVIVSLSSVSHTAISSDNEGYAKTYRTSVTISVSYEKQNSSSVALKVSNYYDYSVDADSTLTTQKKQEAVKIAATKALSDIFSKIAITTLKEKK